MAPEISTRTELVNALRLASELEHGLMVQYLFAAYSLKRYEYEGLRRDQLEQVRRWTSLMTLVARQEMEHLGLALNMLSAIGGTPSFSRPNMPQRADYYGAVGIKLALTRCDLGTIERFQRFEAPEELLASGTEPRTARSTSGSHWSGAGTWVAAKAATAPKTCSWRCSAAGRSSRRGRSPVLPMSTSTASRTGRSRSCTRRSGAVSPPCRARSASPDCSSAGRRTRCSGGRAARSRGRWTTSISTVSTRSLSPGSPARTRPSGSSSSRARGCGCRPATWSTPTSASSPGSAWRWSRPAWVRSARPVVPNPMTVLQPDIGPRHEVSLIGNVSTLAVARLFNDCYEVMLLLLLYLYSDNVKTQAEADSVMHGAFFPFMTMFVRPLAEILTELPAFDDPGAGNAGPGFELSGDVLLFPTLDATWTLFQERLDALAAGFDGVVGADPWVDLPGQRSGGGSRSLIWQRLDYLRQNMRRLGEDWKSDWTNQGRTTGV